MTTNVNIDNSNTKKGDIDGAIIIYHTTGIFCLFFLLLLFSFRLLLAYFFPACDCHGLKRTKTKQYWALYISCCAKRKLIRPINYHFIFINNRNINDNARSNIFTHICTVHNWALHKIALLYGGGDGVESECIVREQDTVHKSQNTPKRTPKKITNNHSRRQKEIYMKQRTEINVRRGKTALWVFAVCV